MLFKQAAWTDAIREKSLPFHLATIEIIMPGVWVPFDVETNTGGYTSNVAVYKGAARVQMFSNNRDHLGTIVSNPNSEVGYRVQVNPLTGWADSFSTPSNYTAALGARRVLRDWKVLIRNGGENPALDGVWLVVDTFANASSRAVVDIVCTMNSDTAAVSSV